MAHTLRVRPAINPVQKSLFVQEKIAGQYSLEVQLLKKVAGRHGHLTKRILQIAGLPAQESLACFGKLLLDWRYLGGSHTISLLRLDIQGVASMRFYEYKVFGPQIRCQPLTKLEEGIEKCCVAVIF